MQQDGDLLLFRNERDDMAEGYFLDADTIVITTDWENGLHGYLNVVPGEIHWANGSVWTRNLAGLWQSAGQQTQVRPFR